MKPYYDHGGITIYHGDCAVVMGALEKQIQCIVTDPPWLASNGSRVHRREGDGMGVAPSKKCTSLKYGLIGEFDATIIRRFNAIATHDILCGYLELGQVLANIEKTRSVFVWHNTRATPIPGAVRQRDAAFVVWGQKTLARQGGWRSCIFDHASPQGGCMATERILDAAHPAQEPIALFLELMAPLSGRVLDPYMGSGTTLRAAKDLGLEAIGIEREEKYCEMAARRLEQEVFDFGGAQ